MTKKILSLKGIRKKEPIQIEKESTDTSIDDPQKRFLNGVAINPTQYIRLELGSDVVE